MAGEYNNVRSYEISIWTLQDRFLSVLKWATMDCKGLILEPEVVLRDDGTQELSFVIPKFYYNGATRIANPMWLHLENLPLEANMHKLKVIFNKNTEDEAVLEFLVTEVTHDHAADAVDINVKAEGLAFHELGKLGYKISLSETNYTNALEEWELNGLIEEQPLNNIQFWNNLVFKDSDGNWKTNWVYELQMDWSAFSSLYEEGRDEVNDKVVAITPKRSDVLYEDEYVSSWELGEDGKMKSRHIQSTREKCRIIDVSESNIYNITQTIAELFGVFCRYEYEHDEHYQIIGRKVIYYNNYLYDAQGHIDLTYPYSSASINRTVDNSNVITKMFVKGVDYNSNTVTIMDVDANKTKEDYLLNFDYLHGILGVTDELYEEIEDFEATIHQLNARIILTQERIRVLQNLLVEAEASATTYRNAVSLDLERWEAAGKLRAELTGGTNRIPLTGKPCIVKEKEDYGFYITIGWDGVEETSLKIYQTNNYTGSASAFSNLITSRNFVYNEFNNLIRVDHITSDIEIKEGDTLWLDGYYNPTLAYDNIQKVWAQRKAIDEYEAEKAENRVIDYKWYLNGIRTGYARVDECRLGIANWPPAIASEPGLPFDVDDTNRSDRADLCRAAFSGIPFKINDQVNPAFVNQFAQLNDLNSSPDLLFYEKNLIEQKMNEISKFERMMGPALREGYWQPDNYHDYGDLFKDTFTISYDNAKIVLPSTAHVEFIWDGDKYYEAETPLVYTANVEGNVELHLTVDVSDYLDQIIEHLDDLSFVYYNPSNIATIHALEDKLTDVNTNVEKFLEKDKNGEIAGEFFSVVNALKTNFERIDLTSFQANGADYSNINYWRVPPSSESTDEVLITPLKTIIDTIISAAEPARQITTVAEIYSTDSINVWRNLDTLLESGIAKVKELITMIGEERAKAATEVRLALLDNINTVLEDNVRTIQNIQTMLSANTEENKGILYYLEEHSRTQSWITSLNNTKYSSYTVGSECELGWVYLKEGSSRIPVLIITGAKTLDDDTFNFITTNYYKVTTVDADNVEFTNEWKKANTAYSFIGVPARDSDGNIILGQWKIIKELTNTHDFVGLKVENNYHAIRVVDKQDYDGNGVPRFPTPQEYGLVRQYPRLYFDTLKLKEDELKIFRGTYQLKNYEEYYTLEDDRSKGINVLGIGYYVTIKPEFIYSSGRAATAFTLIYILSNIDVSIYLDALNVMYENSRPKVSYEVELSVLNPDFIHTAYKRLNQIVHINDNDLELENVSGYISTITMKLDKFWEDTIEIKNYETKFEDLFSTIVAQTEAMKSTRPGLNSAISAFTSTGLIDSNVIYNSINSANLNLSFGKGTLTIDLELGIWGSSDSGVVAFRGGGIFTATEKDNGGNWIWNTGILPSGINANLITTGQLDTNKIKVYAGNELRFQWNGDGLYAYKSFTSDYKTITNNILAPNNLIDLKQYVVFNPDGLFLTSEAGSYIPQKILDLTGNVSYNYKKLDNTVQRVEISWKGLILRDWGGNDVFYADPDTGNLTLKGRVEAASGSIGGWQINKTMLSGYGINLVSGGENVTGNDVAGIYLANTQELCETVTINNSIYYVYKYTDTDGQEKECYYSEYKPGKPSLDITDETIYIKAPIIVSVYPKYTYEFYTLETSNTVTSSFEHLSLGTIADGETIEVLGNPTTGNTIIYIVSSSGSTTPIKDLNGVDIVYNMSTSPDAEWYDAVIKAHGSDYRNYITEVKSIGYKPILFTGTIRPISNPEITFSVKANTGETTILAGQIGNFIVNKDSLSGGTITNTNIDKDNYYEIGDQRHTFGSCFCDLAGSSETGEFTFTRVDGSTVNFNIAAMDAYKRAVAAAGAITLSLKNENGTVIAIARSGAGVEVRLEVTVLSTSSGSSSSGASLTNDCQNNCRYECTKECAYSCTGGCKSTCRGTCKTNCSGTCSGTSSPGCLIAGTPVWLANGSCIPIEDLTAGMQVMAYDPITNTFGIDIVMWPLTFKNSANLVELHFSTEEIIIATKGHPFLTTDGWKALDVEVCRLEQHYISNITELQIGDKIITKQGTATLLKVKARKDLDGSTVYNCRLNKYHTYLIGSGLVTHNAKVYPVT